MNSTTIIPILKTGILTGVLLLSACIYRIDIEQGNLLEEDVIDQVAVGMTRSQVQFLLGSPMVSDSFHGDRWDYTYYFQAGRSRNIERRWFIVYFENDRVTELDKNAVPEPVG